MSKERLKPQQFGASQFIWDEENFHLTSEQKQELADLYAGNVGQFKPGTIIKGRVLTANSDGVLVDINYKSDGLIPMYEFTEHELKRLTPGSEIEVILDELENVDGNVILSYEKAKALKAWDAIMKLYESQSPVEGVVTHKVKGGLSVDIGIPAFLPGSQVDVQRVTDFDQFVGQTITANIIKVNQKRGNVIISRRKYLHEQRAESRKKVLDTISKDSIIQGVVKNITNYGVFVDIGGVDGLLHITDMTWGRISHPSELVHIGDTITAKVLSFDKANEKISLGMKQLSDNPWQSMSDTIQIGAHLKGVISSITDYGLFVEVEKGVEGLVHISEISWTDRITDLHKHYKVGQEIDVVVVALDKENRRMSLSIKQREKNPWDVVDEQFTVGQHITGKISNVTDFGIFIQLLPGVDGLVHISDISWTEHIEHPQDIFKRGDMVEAVVLSINKPSKKISLGIKQLTQNPWEDIEKTYPLGSIIEGEVSKITNFGAFVKLQTGIEGLIHISEFPNNAVPLKVGDKVSVKVNKVSQEDHKLGLTLKLDESAERTERNDKARAGASAKKAEKPAKKERRSDMSMVSQAPRGKSLLQLELEKHAARQQEGSGSSDQE